MDDDGQSDHDFGPPEVDEYTERAKEKELMSGPQKIPGPGDGQMRHTPNPEAQLERDREAVEEARDSDRLAKAAERTRRKGTQR